MISKTLSLLTIYGLLLSGWGSPPTRGAPLPTSAPAQTANYDQDFTRSVPAPTFTSDSDSATLSPTPETRTQATVTPRAVNTERDKNNAPTLRTRQEQCAANSVTQRLFQEYGAVFVADASQTTLPDGCFFANETEVARFQNRLNKETATVGGISVQLQKPALDALLTAVKEAQKQGLRLTPRGNLAARRSYADTLRLWQQHAQEGLDYWQRQGRLTRTDAAQFRSLKTDAQVAQVLAWEQQGYYFGKGFGKSILQSVAAPGASQHLLLLALDVVEFDNPQIRTLLARNGWFQTVHKDAPHFTYLGFKETELPALGLQRVRSSGLAVWVVKTPQTKTKQPQNIRKDTNQRTPTMPTGKKSPAVTPARQSSPPVNQSDKGRASVPAVAKKPQRQAISSTGGEKLTRPRTVRPRPAAPEYQPPAPSGQTETPAETTVPRTAVKLPRSIPATMSKGIVLSPRSAGQATQLASDYHNRTGQMLHLTSGQRTPEEQARIMYDNARNQGGIGYLVRLYGRGPVVEAYRRNWLDRKRAIAEMVAVIRSQMARGRYISRHLRGNALDVRRTARFSILQDVAQDLGSSVLVESDHYHVNL